MKILKRLDSDMNDLHLICFPFAGGYSASFRPLHKYLRGTCTMHVVEPPGHGTNTMPLESNFENLVNLYRQMLLEFKNDRFILFGHSMGGLMVYRLLQELEMEGVYPEVAIISAIQAPNIKRKKMSQLGREEFVNYVAKLGGIPEELLENKDILDYFLPSLRSDYRALEEFKHKNHTIVQTPVHIFNGRQDYKCFNNQTEWSQWIQTVNYHDFDGGHMFPLSNPEKVALKIQQILQNIGIYHY
ncbi:alpha/beta fold hydrolase [Bacillus sp. FJAT-51639]|uniref:Alpha/beta fold hydrolase n=2 Tax=Bacillus bruguierae TaxID=3127667 RepID=A0ABU8FKS6_9BACI